MVKNALEAYGYKMPDALRETFTSVRKTHNSGVFDVYTDEMKRARKSGILTGLPDGYGRGRIIGDYRRVALYGVDALIEAKKADLKGVLLGVMDEEKIRLREEVQEQIRALQELKQMAAAHGHDVGRPAASAREAVQWLYYAYLGAVKEQDGAAMSMVRRRGRGGVFCAAFGGVAVRCVCVVLGRLSVRLHAAAVIKRPAQTQTKQHQTTTTTTTIQTTSKTPKHQIETGPHRRVPRHVLRARPRVRRADRARGAGADRPVRDEDAHRAPAAHP